jgi:hypothetical protein
VERQRDRGIGDLLFVTGPLSYLRHVSGKTCKLYVYTLSDRAPVLLHSPHLHAGGALVGPVAYDELENYNFHWFIDSVTECNSLADQRNVYDELYAQLGLDPAIVPASFKRPNLTLTDGDKKAADGVYYTIWRTTQLNLRTTDYVTVAPLSHSSLRSLNYSAWLSLIHELSKLRPVVVVGRAIGTLPFTDMPFGEFNTALSQLGPSVINLLGSYSPYRTVAALIANSRALVALDSGLLFTAQALRTPAVSIWGPLDPALRLGYDEEYMKLALWNKPACRHSPCYAYAEFPLEKCPAQFAPRTVCECLSTVSNDAVLSLIEPLCTT